jgi:hypothetical protein
MAATGTTAARGTVFQYIDIGPCYSIQAQYANCSDLKGKAMTIQASGHFEWTNYQEQPYSRSEAGPRLTYNRVTNIYHGDIEGTGTQAYLTVYCDDRPIGVTGLEQFVGRLGSHVGSFVLQGTATMEGANLRASWAVVPGSGTGELAGLRGVGGYTYIHGQPQTPYTFDYDVDD